MKTTKLMRDVMVAASLIAVTACGAVEPLNPDESIEPGDSETDAGVGTDSDAEMPIVKCTSSADCDDGMACDLATKECVASVLSLDANELVYDGLRWWTNTSGPKLAGSFMGPSGSVVQVKVGTNTGILATITGSRWSVQLPTGSITASDTLITVMLTAPGGGLATHERILALDTTPPVVALQASKVRDERSDVITFDGTGPVHEHIGAEVDLADGVCPTIYKFGYLLDSQAPAFGKELAANTLAWKFSVGDAKATSAEYRVRASDGAVLRDWVATSMIGSGLVIPLFRDGAGGVQELGEQAGEYHLDVRVHDWAGNETIATACWNHQPLAAPLEVKPVMAATDVDALATWSLVSDSPVSKLIGIARGATLFEQHIVQHTTEPLLMTASSTVPTGTFERTVLNGYVSTASSYVAPGCDTVNCYPTQTLATPQSSSGALTGHSVSMRLFDDVDGHEILTFDSAGRWSIPGRDVNGPPRAYTVRIELNQVSSLRPSSSWSYGEYNLGGKTYTGTASTSHLLVCATRPTEQCNRLDVCILVCEKPVYYDNINALDRAKLTLDPVTTTFNTAASTNAPLRQAAYVSPSSRHSPAFVWDSGDDDLPGIY